MPATPIDEAELQARADALLEAVAPGCKVEPITPLQGGASSITYWTTFAKENEAPQKVVLKVAPAGLEPTKNRDVLRQARLQAALTGSDVPAPAVLAQHGGSPPEVPPFFIMRFEAGDCVEPNFLPPDAQLPAEETRARELQAAHILGRLHALEPASVGLDDEPEVGLTEEVERWVKSFAACEPDLQEGSHEIGERLVATAPPTGSTCLIHGDYRLGNTLSKGTEVVSVIDWEIYARGDARVDLAWFLMMANPDAALGRTQAPGMPSDAELLDTYQNARGVNVADLEWFAALVRYKQAAAGSLIARNARRRGNTEATSASNPQLFASARQLLGL